MKPLRITKKQVCEMLSISIEQLRKLTNNDPTFPKPHKTGTYIQSKVYFDYAEIEQWYEQQKG